LITILATAIGAWISVQKYLSDSKRELDLREKELTERIDNQYRDDLKQLLEFPINNKQTTASVSFLLQDLQQLIKGRPNQKEEARNEQKYNIAMLLATLAKSADYREDRSIDFDLTALRQWESYPIFLGADSKRSIAILNRYHHVLRQLHDVNPKFFESLYFHDQTTFRGRFPPKNRKDEITYIQFVKLVEGYARHVQIMRERSSGGSGNPTKLEGDLTLAFCWFFEDTQNESLTSGLFNLNNVDIKGLFFEQCGDIKK
jgi:hypothetical protein